MHDITVGGANGCAPEQFEVNYDNKIVKVKFDLLGCCN